MIRFSSPKKFFSVGLAKRLNQYFRLCFVVLLLQSCKDGTKEPGKTDNSSDSTQTSQPNKPRALGAAGIDAVNDSLFILYIDNVNDSSQLKKLLKGPSGHKAVFNFFRDSGNHLRLIAYSRHNGRDTFERGRYKIVRPHITPTLGDLLPGANTEVYLGNVEFEKKVLDSLRRNIYQKPTPQHPHPNNSNYSYIYLYPTVEPDSLTNLNYIRYEVWKSDSLSYEKSSWTGTTPIGYANPSPPHKPAN